MGDWIAVTATQDLAHEKATALTRSAPPGQGTIFTTDEVLAEYLNYFAAWGPHFRCKAAANVQIRTRAKPDGSDCSAASGVVSGTLSLASGQWLQH
jgi:hypothetical protein